MYIVGALSYFMQPLAAEQIPVSRITIVSTLCHISRAGRNKLPVSVMDDFAGRCRVASVLRRAFKVLSSSLACAGWQ